MKRLNVRYGTAILLGGVLGPGVLVLPQLGAAVAGPASILAWAALLLLSAPVAITFAVLGVRYPDGGGVAAFARRAFGDRTAAVVGIWFYGVIPLGTFAGALVGAEAAAAALGLGRGVALVTAVLLMAAAFAVNAAGLRTSGRVQMWLLTLLVGLLGTAIVTAAVHVRAAHFTPFAPHGAGGVAAAIGVLLFAFVGWEAASHLSADFAADEADEAGRRGRRVLMRSTQGALAIVGVLYLALAVVTVGVLGPRAAESGALGALLETGIGPAARPILAVAALLLSFGGINTYLAGAARLGAALARERVLPRWFARGGEPGAVPLRSLGLLAAMSAACAVPLLVLNLDLDFLLRVTAACLAAVTLVGAASAVRLLPPGRERRTATVGTALSAVALACCGPFLLAPALLAALTLAGSVGRGPRPQPPAPDSPAEHPPAEHPPAEHPAAANPAAANPAYLAPASGSAHPATAHATTPATVPRSPSPHAPQSATA
ncbi:amino acid efflux transporter [Catenuloplanes nepalensis]|uniref:Amino acid efflux transporter n=1 Tax=Catenuloplanes nepalensis TaxID=587533 RepID=A0ABT9N859_9ACTN|nr:amino acid permease [Catenuloplanes nepalensis]MDP9799886.1 amino acid efflux transporter [Catenuloplanes nepalensis]